MDSPVEPENDEKQPAPSDVMPAQAGIQEDGGVTSGGIWILRSSRRMTARTMVFLVVVVVIVVVIVFSRFSINRR